MHWQYAFEDFALRQVALLLNKTDDVEKYTNRSLVRLSTVSIVLPLLQPRCSSTATSGTLLWRAMVSRVRVKNNAFFHTMY